MVDYCSNLTPSKDKQNLPALLGDDHFGVERVEAVPEFQIVEMALERGQPSIRADRP